MYDSLILPEIVQDVTSHYLENLPVSLKANLTGLYLTGSVPLKDYHHGKSDIDFIAVVEKEFRLPELKLLAQLHRQIERKFRKPRFNGYYLHLEGISKKQNFFPAFYKNKFYPALKLELLNVTLLELTNTSYKIFGLPPNLILPVVDPDLADQELLVNTNGYWQTWIKNHSFPFPGYLILLAFPRLTEWGVLGMARQFYTIETGGIASKKLAGQYLLHRLPVNYHQILNDALDARKTTFPALAPSCRRAKQTIDCMKYLTVLVNQRIAQKG